MTDIDEAISYIESTEKHLRHLGESWYADYLSDAIDLLKDATLCCTLDMNHFVDTWFKTHEMYCCEKKEHKINGQK